jgi:FtsZ-binding cell division protein ZapB
MHGYKNIKTAFGFSIMLCFAALLLSNTDGDNFKRWDINHKLGWSEFIVKAMGHSDRAALTNSGIRLSMNQTSQSTVAIEVYSIMDKSKSWVDGNKKSDYTLSHEQYHFNITEYWSRKLKKDISAGRFTTRNIKEKIAAIRKEDFMLMNDMQTEYDKDSKHSEIESEQRKWQKKVDALLKSVEDYSADAITVSLK